MVWTRHWKLRQDPFLGPAPPYVPVASHEEAVARLVDTVETGERRAVVHAAAGLGKSMILARSVALTRNPGRRSVLVSSPGEGAELIAALANGLGRRVPPGAGAGQGSGWKRLDEAVRLCRWQRLGIVVAVDDCHHLLTPADRLALERLVHLDPHPATRLTVLLAHRTDDESESPSSTPPAPGELSIRLPGLTRSDVELYLIAKLAWAGRDEPTFTPRAIHRLHAASSGNPRTLDRLASLALMAGALRGLEIVTPDVIDGVARECSASAPLLLA